MGRSRERCDAIGQLFPHLTKLDKRWSSGSTFFGETEISLQVDGHLASIIAHTIYSGKNYRHVFRVHHSSGLKNKSSRGFSKTNGPEKLAAILHAEALELIERSSEMERRGEEPPEGTDKKIERQISETTLNWIKDESQHLTQGRFAQYPTFLV